MSPMATVPQMPADGMTSNTLTSTTESTNTAATVVNMSSDLYYSWSNFVVLIH